MTSFRSCHLYRRKMNKPHRKLINASLGSSNVRYWLGAVKLTDLKVCYERGADIANSTLCQLTGSMS